MTPQQLIDLPYAGSATKQLIKQGDWNDPASYADQARRIQELADKLADELEERE